MIEQLKLVTLVIIASRRLELFKAARGVLDKQVEDDTLEKIINAVPNGRFVTQWEKENDQLKTSITLEEIINENKDILNLISNHLSVKKLLK